MYGRALNQQMCRIVMWCVAVNMHHWNEPNVDT